MGFSLKIHIYKKKSIDDCTEQAREQVALLVRNNVYKSRYRCFEKHAVCSSYNVEMHGNKNGKLRFVCRYSLFFIGESYSVHHSSDDICIPHFSDIILWTPEKVIHFSFEFIIHFCACVSSIVWEMKMFMDVLYSHTKLKYFTRCHDFYAIRWLYELLCSARFCFKIFGIFVSYH